MTKVYRSVCAKHPELEGLRYAANGNCPSCHLERVRADRAANPKEGKVKGKVCAKHPKLKGMRYAASRNCVGCNIDAVKARRNKP